MKALSVMSDREYVSKAQSLLYEFLHGDITRRWLLKWISIRCPDCGETLGRPDGWHVMAELWCPFAVILTCSGRRVIPLARPAGC